MLPMVHIIATALYHLLNCWKNGEIGRNSEQIRRYKAKCRPAVHEVTMRVKILPNTLKQKIQKIQFCNF
jgi:hypothetical protein